MTDQQLVEVNGFREKIMLLWLAGEISTVVQLIASRMRKPESEVRAAMAQAVIVAMQRN